MHGSVEERVVDPDAMLSRNDDGAWLFAKLPARGRSREWADNLPVVCC